MLEIMDTKRDALDVADDVVKPFGCGIGYSGLHEVEDVSFPVA